MSLIDAIEPPGDLKTLGGRVTLDEYTRWIAACSVLGADPRKMVTTAIRQGLVELEEEAAVRKANGTARKPSNRGRKPGSKVAAAAAAAPGAPAAAGGATKAPDLF